MSRFAACPEHSPPYAFVFYTPLELIDRKNYRGIFSLGISLLGILWRVVMQGKPYELPRQVKTEINVDIIQVLSTNG